MRGKGRFAWLFLMFSFCSFIPQISHAVEYKHVNSRAAILYDMSSGKVLYEQSADASIPPASLTKILTLYLTFEAIESGQISLCDKVRVSSRAASMPKVRMGLRRGDLVTVSQLIHGMAIESGNDAAAAMAEHLSGSIESFVVRMNAKARELGMTNSRFMTPNGLPAAGQLTTARDILKLSIAYISRFPEALSISSIRSYTYKGKTDHNPNNLLGRCPGVDGLKTGFVCASGFNISATALRDHNRLIAVVLGARSPGVRCVDAENLFEAGYREIGGTYYAVGAYPHSETASKEARCARGPKVRSARRAHARLARLAAGGRATRATRRAAMKTGGSRVRITRANARKMRTCSSARPERIASKTASSRRRKAAAPTVKKATGRKKIVAKNVCKKAKLAKTVSRTKTVRAGAAKSAAKASAKTRSGCNNKRKVVERRSPRVKTAIKKRHHGASHARRTNKTIG